jgi:hypothetical protein
VKTLHQRCNGRSGKHAGGSWGSDQAARGAGLKLRHAGGRQGCIAGTSALPQGPWHDRVSYDVGDQVTCETSVCHILALMVQAVISQTTDHRQAVTTPPGHS